MVSASVGSFALAGGSTNHGFPDPVAMMTEFVGIAAEAELVADAAVRGREMAERLVARDERGNAMRIADEVGIAEAPGFEQGYGIEECG